MQVSSNAQCHATHLRCICHSQVCLPIDSCLLTGSCSIPQTYTDVQCIVSNKVAIKKLAACFHAGVNALHHSCSCVWFLVSQSGMSPQPHALPVFRQASTNPPCTNCMHLCIDLQMPELQKLEASEDSDLISCVCVEDDGKEQVLQTRCLTYAASQMHTAQRWTYCEANASWFLLDLYGKYTCACMCLSLLTSFGLEAEYLGPHSGRRGCTAGVSPCWPAVWGFLPKWQDFGNTQL